VRVRYAKNTQPNFLDFRFTGIVIFGRIIIMKKMPSEIEKKMLEKDMIVLAIGMIIAMVIVWLTISVPPKKQSAYTSKCYEICKEDVNQRYNFEKGMLLTRAKFIIEMGECMDECEEVKNEQSENMVNKR
jgi:hypothetical protein